MCVSVSFVVVVVFFPFLNVSMCLFVYILQWEIGMYNAVCSYSCSVFNIQVQSNWLVFFLLPGYRSCIPKYNVCIWMQFSNRIRLLLKFGNQSAITTIAYFHNKMIKRSFLLFITRWIYRFRMHECASLECDSVWIFFSFSPYFCHCFVIFWHIIFGIVYFKSNFELGFPLFRIELE